MGSRTNHALAGLVAVLAIAMILAGLWYYRREWTALRAQRQEEIQAIAVLKAGEIARWRDERLKWIRRDATGVTRAIILRWLEQGAGAAGSQDLVERLASLREVQDAVNLLLATPDGEVLLSVTPDSPRLGTPSRGILDRTVATGEAVFGEPYVCEVCGEFHLDVTAPVLDDHGHVVAVLIQRSDPRRDLFPIVRFWPTASPTAETLLVRRDGDEVLFLSDPRHRMGQALTLRLPLTRTDIAAVQAVLGRTGAFEGKDHRGEEVLAHLLPVAGSPWVLVATVDREEVLADAREKGRLIAGLVVLGILATAAAGGLVASRLRQRYREEVARAEGEHRATLERASTVLRSIGDAVITTDAEGRVTLMNPVAERLTGWPEPEAVGRRLAEVFRIVNEQTRAPVEDPVSRVLREGAVVGLANHTLLLARDGTERPVADSGAPVRDGGGRITGVVLVFRDQTDERRAEEALRRSEAFNRAIIECIPQRLYVKDRDSVYLAANPSYAKSLGLDPGDLVGRDDFAFFPGELADKYRADDQEVMSSGQVKDIEEDYVARGVTHTIHTIKAPLRDSGGRVIGVLGLFEDITERKRNEAAIRINAARDSALLALYEFAPKHSRIEVLREALDQIEQLTGSSIGFFHLYDEDARRLTLAAWSTRTVAAFCRVQGAAGDHYSIDQAGVWADCVHQRRPVIHNDYASLAHRKGMPDGHAPVVRELVVPVMRSGRIVAVVGVGNKPTDYDDADVETVSFLADIAFGLSEARRAEESLVESERRFRMFYEESPLGYQSLDRDMTLLEVNPRWLEILGYSREEVLGRRFTDFVVAENVDRCHDIFAEFLERGSVDGVELTVRKRDGTLAVVSFDGRVSHHADGSFREVHCVMRDITALRRAEEERRHFEAHARQQQKLEAIGTLAAGVAHEINNPLNVMLNYAQLLVDEAASPDRVRDFAGNILKEGDRVAEIVRNLLSFARHENETHGPARLGDVVERTLSLVRAVFRKDQIHVACEVPAGLPAVRCRSRQIQQVLMNLLVNARDALNERYPKASEDKVLRIGVSRFEKDGRGWQRVTVEDHGPGIAPEIQGRVFDPFFTTKGRDKGTGLGLSISHGLVAEHGGALWFETEVGRGTRFHVDLPEDNGWRLDPGDGAT